MAERLFLRSAGDRHAARSAGRAPGAAVHSNVLEALREIGIDASNHTPSALDDDKVEWADVVVATCDNACPVIPGKRYVSWELPDPKNLRLDQVREIRDDIERRVGELLEEAEPRRGATPPRLAT